MTKPNPLAGWRPTLTEFSGRLADARGLSDNERRVAQQVLDAYRQSVVATMERVYDDGAAHRDREYDTAERILSALGDLVTDTVEQFKRGEIDHEQLLQTASEVERDRQRIVQASRAAEEVEQRAWEDTSVTPEAFQSQVLSRFPAMRSRLPRITEAVMQGLERPQF